MKCPDCGDWVDCRISARYPDKMPQAIKLIDAEGRSCIYVPITQGGR